MTLSKNDIDAIATAVAAKHECRFADVSTADMGMLKDLLQIYKETRSEIMKWVVRGAVVGIIFLMVSIAAVKTGVVK